MLCLQSGTAFVTATKVAPCSNWVPYLFAPMYTFHWVPKCVLAVTAAHSGLKVGLRG